MKVDMLVNNAGFSTFGNFVNTPVTDSLRQIEVNITALVALTAEFLTDLVDSARDSLVNITLTASFQPVPVQAIYGATKAFVLSFTEAIGHDLRGAKVRVPTICPGPTDTELFEVAEHPAVSHKKSPTEVVTVTLDRLERKHPSTLILGVANRLQSALMQRLPRRWVPTIVANRFLFTRRRI